MDQDEWITYDVEADLESWLEKYKPSQILKTSSSKVCGIAISVPISSNTLNNNTSELEEGFNSLTSQKDDTRLLHVEEQAATVFVSTDKLLLKVNSLHVDDVWRGLVINLHEGQFRQKVYRVEVSLAADMNKMKTDYVICVYNENFRGTYQSLNGNDTKENNNDPVIDRRNVVRNKNDKKAKIKKPCKNFNEGSCKVKTAHLSKSRLTRWVHICRFCYAKCGDEKPHPESQCKYKKNADDQNITKSTEGSKFTLVTSNVYPSCSCRGGNKGCNTNSCNCIKFSQECLPSCGCGQSCVNMGLTRGHGKQIRIGESKVQGDGCFTEEDIGKGEYVGEYTGELVLRAEQLKKENPSKFLFEIGHNDFLLDAEKFGSQLAKMNHKTEKMGANCVYKLKRANREWRVGVWAFKNIKKDEELFANYSNNYRGNGLFTPTKKKNKGRRKGAKVEEKERQRPLIEKQLSQSPRPAAVISNATKISHEEINLSPIIKKKTRSSVSKEKSLGASSLTDLSTPIRVVSGRAINSSPSNCDTAQPRVIKLDSPNETTPNQSLNAELRIAKDTKKLFEKKVKSIPNVATKIPILNANKENVRMPTVTISPKEKDICEGNLYTKLSEEKTKSIPNVSTTISILNANKENVRMPTVIITPKEKDICKRMLYNSGTPVRSTPQIKVTPVMSTLKIKITPVRIPWIKAKADEEFNPGNVEQDIDEEERT